MRNVPTQVDRGTVLRCLGDSHRNHKQHDQAIKCYDNAIRLLEQRPAAEAVAAASEIAAIWNSIGLVKYNQGTYTEALDFHDKCLNALQHTGDCDETYRALKNKANALRKLADYERANAVYEEALAMAERLKGKQHLDTAKILHSIGNVLRKLCKQQEALSKFEQALEIKIKLLGADHDETSKTLACIGNIHCDTKKYDEAIEFLERSKSGTKQTLGEQTEDTARTLRNLATAYRGKAQVTGDVSLYASAADNYMQALAITRKAIGEIHSDNARILYHIGKTYLHLIRVLRAPTPLILPSTSSSPPLNGTSSSESSTSISESNMYSGMINYEGQHSWVNSVTLPGSSSSLKSLVTLATSGFGQKFGTAAVVTAQPEIQLIQFGLTAVVNAFAAFARKCFNESLAIDKQVLLQKHDSHPETAETYNALGELEEMLGNESIAFDYFSTAKEMWAVRCSNKADQRIVDAELKISQLSKSMSLTDD